MWFVHLFHLNILMCTFRRALQGFRDPEAGERLLPDQMVSLNGALEVGIVAAEQSSRLLTRLNESITTATQPLSLCPLPS